MQKQQKHGKREKKKERERERRRRRRRRRRRNGDASSISDYISPWLRSFNNGGKYPKKKNSDLVEPLRTGSGYCVCVLYSNTWENLFSVNVLQIQIEYLSVDI